LYVDFVNAATLRYKTGDTKQLDKTIAETKRNEIKLLFQEIYFHAEEEPAFPLFD
jgi:cobalt-zinc-cadmium resistance protein CzcA